MYYADIGIIIISDILFRIYYLMLEIISENYARILINILHFLATLARTNIYNYCMRADVIV
jgi:hypothetical protein